MSAQDGNSGKNAQGISNAHYLGVATCASSNCHGGTAPRTGNSVLQNEYVTWQKHDRHSLAYSVLQGEQGKRIAHNLNIAAPENEPMCLACHATYTADKGRYDEKFRMDDGVGCESCHGASEKWLKEHTASDATHARNLENGMIDLGAVDKRTELCATCHVGSANQDVTHRIMGAGHPRLSFELDTFSMIQPKHWEVDDDYVKRKGAYSSAQAWLVGQVVLARENLEKLTSKTRSQEGIMPELTLMYCYSCHHSLADEQYKKKEYGGKPGLLRLNIAHLVIVREAMGILNPGLAQELAGKIDQLHHDFTTKEVSGNAKELINVLNSKALPAASAIKLTDTNFNSLMHALLEFGAKGSASEYEVAEQIAMGVSSLLATKDPDGRLYKLQLEELYKALKSPESYDIEDFTNSSASFLKAL